MPTPKHIIYFHFILYGLFFLFLYFLMFSKVIHYFKESKVIQETLSIYLTHGQNYIVVNFSIQIPFEVTPQRFKQIQKQKFLDIHFLSNFKMLSFSIFGVLCHCSGHCHSGYLSNIHFSFLLHNGSNFASIPPPHPNTGSSKDGL